MKTLLRVLAFLLASTVFAQDRPVHGVMLNFPDRGGEPFTPMFMMGLLNDFEDTYEASADGLENVIATGETSWHTFAHPYSHYCTSAAEQIGNIEVTFAELAAVCPAIWEMIYECETYGPPVSSALHICFVSGFEPFGLGQLISADSSANLVTLMHEIGGHSFNKFLHDGSWGCGTFGSDTGVDLDHPYANGCFAGRYSGYSWMGAAARDFSAFHKVQAQIIPPSQVLKVGVTANSFHISPLSDTTPTYAREIRVNLENRPSVFYTMDYRPGVGVIIWLHLPNTMTYPNGEWADADIYWVNEFQPITMTDSFVDEHRGISVTMTAATPDYATLYIVSPYAEPHGGGGPGGDCTPFCYEN